MGRFTEVVVDNEPLKRLKLDKSLAVTDKDKLLLLESRVGEVIDTAAAWLALFPTVTQDNFRLFKTLLSDYFLLDAYDRESVDTINNVLIHTKNGLKSQQESLVVKVASPETLGGTGVGEVKMHPVIVSGLDIPQDLGKNPVGTAPQSLVDSLPKTLYKYSGKSNTPKDYKHWEGVEKNSDWSKVSSNTRRTYVLATKQGLQRACLFAMGDIHMLYGYFFLSLGEAVQTFVHEATHKFGNTSDMGVNRGYFRLYDPQYRPKLTPEEALRNADSYAMLVYKFSLGENAEWKR
jgi:hypothetical protein